MRKVLYTAMAVLVSGTMAVAGGDKAATAFVNTSAIDTPAATFQNGISAGTSKSGGCTIQIQLKKLQGLTDGDQIICIGSADVKATSLPPTGAGNSVVWRVPAKAGAVKIKNSVAVITVGPNFCGSAKTISWNATTKCFLPDGAYNPATACNGEGSMAWFAAPVGTVNLLGLCQGFVLGDRIPDPASGVIAETGATILLGAK